jgi:hypothetical protein
VKPAALVLGVALALAAPAAHAGEGLDWEVREAPAGPFVTWLRGVRDGGVELLDAAADLQIGVFSEIALDLGGVAMAASDGIGLIDDNALSQHVFKAVASKSLARTAYLLHTAGAEAIRGSHGLETEWYLADTLEELNPLLADAPAEPRLPLDPQAFVGEGLVHTDVYRVQRPGAILGASLLADAVVRPAAGLVRMAGLARVADRWSASARSLVRGALP